MTAKQKARAFKVTPESFNAKADFNVLCTRETIEALADFSSDTHGYIPKNNECLRKLRVLNK